MTRRAPKTIAISITIATCLSVGCAPGDATSSTDDDVVGIADLGALEAELGVTKDTKLPNGTWSRDVTHGTCFARGRAAQPPWEYRRWTTGAAFFDKKADVPGAGDSREIKCVDLDADGGWRLDRFMLDIIVRNHLGALGQTSGAAGSVGTSFANGFTVGISAVAECGVVSTFLDPCLARPDVQTCIDECAAKLGEKIEAPTLAEPATTKYFLHTIQGPTGSPHPQIAAVVARTAAKIATAYDHFDMASDPIGALVSTDGGGLEQWEHARYARFDAHRLAHDSGETIVVVGPKGSDADPWAGATVRCHRAPGDDAFDCEGPGQPLAP